MIFSDAIASEVLEWWGDYMKEVQPHLDHFTAVIAAGGKRTEAYRAFRAAIQPALQRWMDKVAGAK